MLYIQIVFSLVYLLVTSQSFRKYGFLRDVLVFFVTLYSMQLIVAIADPYHVYTIQFSTVLLFNLQIIFLLFGAQVALGKGYRPREFDTERIFDFKINNPVLLIQSCFLVLAFYRYRKMSSFLLQAAMSNEARSYFFSDFYSSYTELLLNQVLDSFVFVSYFFAFGLLFFAKKFSIKELYIIISTLAIVTLNTLTSFGRNVVFQLLVAFIMFFLLSRHFDKISFKKRAIPVLIVFVSLVGIVLVATTVVRANLGDVGGLEGELDELLFRPFIEYFYVPVCAFEYGSQHIFNDIVPMLGAADLAAPIDVLLTPIRIFDHSIYSPNEILGIRMSPVFNFPNSGLQWNALFTGASNYYIDFGFLGFIFFPFIHGFLFPYLGYRGRRRGSWFLIFFSLFLCSFTHLTCSGIQSMSIVFFVVWVIFIRKTRAVT